jgi:hypothetical protein
MTTLVSLNYKGKQQTVALFEGLSPDELTSVLKTVFDFSGNVVGILAEVSGCANPFCCWSSVRLCSPSPRRT